MPQHDIPASITRKPTKRNWDRTALLDLGIVVATLVIVKQSLLPFSQLYAGPASTLSAMVVATLLLRKRGIGWAELGLRWPASWWRTIGWTVVCFAAVVATAAAIQPVADALFVDIGTSGRFDHVEGNWAAYLGIMLLVWTHGSFFEELLFRAFFIDKASRFLGGGLAGDIAAAVTSSVFFGYRHYYYQGMHGALVTGALGLAFAILYLWIGRKNVLPLIFAHGIMNSIAQTMRFLGLR